MTPILAEAGVETLKTTLFLAQWLVVVFSIVSGIGGMLAIGSYFATRREVDDIKERLVKTENSAHEIRAEMRKEKDEINAMADARSSRLHDRINPISENLAALKASSEAFVTAFHGFTQLMQGKACPIADVPVEKIIVHDKRAEMKGQ
jgi:hypothetical protein